MLTQVLAIVETKINSRSRSRSSSILDHFPDIRWSSIEQFQSKHRPIFLSYTSEHLLYIWILLLRYIADANTGTCHCRDEINSRSSSILDHFPDIWRSNSCWIRSRHRRIFLSYTSEHLLYIWILFYDRFPMLTQVLVIVETKWGRDQGRVPSWTIFPILDEVTHAEYNRGIDVYSLTILQNIYSIYRYCFAIYYQC